MTPVSITVVGCGAVAQRLYRAALQQLEYRGAVQVQGLVDPVELHARTLQSYFPKAKVFASLDAASSAQHATLALILSPSHLHRQHVQFALERGGHVLCEKPLAMCSADCQALLAAARAARRILAVGMIRRFFPAYEALRQLVVAGRLGDLQSIEYTEGRKFDWDVTTAASFRKRADGGTGVLFDIGPHAVDCLTWLFGQPEVRSYLDDGLGGVESNLSMELSFDRIPGLLRLSWDSPLRNELRVRGSNLEAVLRLDRFDKLAVADGSEYVPVRITQSFPADVGPIPTRRIQPASYPQAIYCQLIQTVRAIELGEPPAADGRAGQQCIDILESALAIAEPLPMPWLESAARVRYRQLHWTAQG